jgi:hypothetical protein
MLTARANCLSETEKTRSQRTSRISRMSNVVLQLDHLKGGGYYQPIAAEGECANLLLVSQRHLEESSLQRMSTSILTGIKIGPTLGRICASVYEALWVLKEWACSE